MTLVEFRKLKSRDFENGAVRDEIEIVIEQRDSLLAACEAALPHLDYEHVPDSIWVTITNVIAKARGQ